MVRVAVKRFGNVDEELLDAIIEAMRECYGRLKPEDVNLVDLYVFEKASAMKAFMNSEKSRLGVTSSPFDDGFFITHDAWLGVPRITVCLEKMRGQPEEVNVGGIRHEVAHTVLHGSPEYYIVPLPKTLRDAGKRYGLPPEIVNDLLYLVSIAVKDYEATRLLYSKGYVEDQVAYCKHFLKPTDEDIQAWKAAQINPLASIIVVASLLKNCYCAAPLIADKKYGDEIREAVRICVAHLPSNLSSRIVAVASQGTLRFGSHTHKNMEQLAQAIVDEFFEALFRGRSVYR